MTSAERRLMLFRLYNRNWRIVKLNLVEPLSNEFEDVVMCPLCGIFFHSSHLDLSISNHLTLEDVPPKSLGGRPAILTCKKCNNTAGHKVDSSVKDFLQKKPFIEGEIGAEMPLPYATIKYEGGKLTSSGRMKILKKDHYEFTLNLKKGEARHSDFEFLGSKINWGFDFRFNTPSVRMVQIGLLRMAYLILFKRFGHSFSFNRNYDGIRNQIANPEANILNTFGVLKLNRTDASEDIYLWKEFEDLKSFVIVFDLKEKVSTNRCIVFIPSPFIDSVKFYKDFATFGTNHQFNFAERFNDYDYLTDLQYTMGWHSAFLN